MAATHRIDRAVGAASRPQRHGDFEILFEYFAREQKKRFLGRIDNPKKHWKFEAADVRERGYWDAYMSAYQAALNATAQPWAPWWSIPADSKPYMRLCVATILRQAMSDMPLAFPTLDRDAVANMYALKEQL